MLWATTWSLGPKAVWATSVQLFKTKKKRTLFTRYRYWFMGLEINFQNCISIFNSLRNFYFSLSWERNMRKRKSHQNAFGTWHNRQLCCRKKWTNCIKVVWGSVFLPLGYHCHLFRFSRHPWEVFLTCSTLSTAFCSFKSGANSNCFKTLFYCNFYFIFLLVHKTSKRSVKRWSVVKWQKAVHQNCWK